MVLKSIPSRGHISGEEKWTCKMCGLREAGWTPLRILSKKEAALPLPKPTLAYIHIQRCRLKNSCQMVSPLCRDMNTQVRIPCGQVGALDAAGISQEFLFHTASPSSPSSRVPCPDSQARLFRICFNGKAVLRTPFYSMWLRNSPPLYLKTAHASHKIFLQGIFNTWWDAQTFSIFV